MAFFAIEFKVGDLVETVADLKGGFGSYGQFTVTKLAKGTVGKLVSVGTNGSQPVFWVEFLMVDGIKVIPVACRAVKKYQP